MEMQTRAIGRRQAGSGGAAQVSRPVIGAGIARAGARIRGESVANGTLKPEYAG